MFRYCYNHHHKPLVSTFNKRHIFLINFAIGSPHYEIFSKKNIKRFKNTPFPGDENYIQRWNWTLKWGCSSNYVVIVVWSHALSELFFEIFYEIKFTPPPHYSVNLGQLLKTQNDVILIGKVSTFAEPQNKLQFRLELTFLFRAHSKRLQNRNCRINKRKREIFRDSLLTRFE